MEWRVIPLAEYPGPLNMALDEAIAESVAKQEQPGTIRFYAWDHPTITLGYNQKIGEDINKDACSKEGVLLVRRPTGGSAVLHFPSDITYSVIVRKSDLPEEIRDDVTKCYHHICDGLIRTLRHERIGLPADRPPEASNDIRVHGTKISGNAQVWLSYNGDRVLLQHGTLLYDFDEPLMRRLIPDKNPGNVGWIKKWKDISREALFGIMVDEFTKGKPWGFGPISDHEFERATTLVKEKYGNPSWNLDQGTLSKGSCYDHFGRGESRKS